MFIHRLLVGSLVEPKARSTSMVNPGRKVHSKGFFSSLPERATSSKEVMQ